MFYFCVPQETVHTQKLYEEYDKTYQDCKRKADTYKKIQGKFSCMLNQHFKIKTK